MALRAFRDNPSLGGFGCESTGISTSLLLPPTGQESKTGRKKSGGTTRDSVPQSLVTGAADDSFAQIVKELVDNAVDACYTATTKVQRQQQQEGRRNGRKKKDPKRKRQSGQKEGSDHIELQTYPALRRVRVVFQPINQESLEHDDGQALDFSPLLTKLATTSSSPFGDDDSGDNENEADMLRVTVTDNGCGMESIENCVAAFHTSKAGAASQKTSSSTQPEDQPQSCTAGRYGIGLTLCLLHAQRLVANSCAMITSATAAHSVWTRAKYVVDADNDDIVCVFKETLEKNSATESGTAVSVLLPVSVLILVYFIKIFDNFGPYEKMAANDPRT